METKTEKITFDEGSALFDVLEMLDDMRKEATREYDYAQQEVYRIAERPDASAMQVQNAVEYQIQMGERMNALTEASRRAQGIYNNMILEAAGLPYYC